MKPTIKDVVTKSERDTIERKARELDKVLHTDEFTGEEWMFLRGVLAGLNYCLGATRSSPLTYLRRYKWVKGNEKKFKPWID